MYITICKIVGSASLIHEAGPPEGQGGEGGGRGFRMGDTCICVAD